VHAGLDALQHGFEASAVGSGHERPGPYAGRATSSSQARRGSA
jgi:hypothetical protein